MLDLSGLSVLQKISIRVLISHPCAEYTFLWLRTVLQALPQSTKIEVRLIYASDQIKSKAWRHHSPRVIGERRDFDESVTVKRSKGSVSRQKLGGFFLESSLQVEVSGALVRLFLLIHSSRFMSYAIDERSSGPYSWRG